MYQGRLITVRMSAALPLWLQRSGTISEARFTLTTHSDTAPRAGEDNPPVPQIRTGCSRISTQNAFNTTRAAPFPQLSSVSPRYCSRVSRCALLPEFIRAARASTPRFLKPFTRSVCSPFSPPGLLSWGHSPTAPPSRPGLTTHPARTPAPLRTGRSVGSRPRISCSSYAVIITDRSAAPV